MAALTAGQVDLAGGVLVVDRALTADRTIGPPKTFAHRSVHLPAAIPRPLADHIAGHVDEPRGAGVAQVAWHWGTAGPQHCR